MGWMVGGLCVLCGLGIVQAQSLFVEGVQTYQALVRDFDETSGGYSPAWSPSGRQVAFLSFADGALWLATIDPQFPSRPAQRARLSPRSERRDTPRWFRELRQVDWSPDGNRIVFARYDKGLWTAEGDFSKSKPDVRVKSVFSDDNKENEDTHTPRFSPDGKHLAFIEETDAPGEILWVMDFPSRENKRRLADRVVGEPVWSPDGQWIAYARRDDDRQREMLSLWIVSADGASRQVGTPQTRRITTDKQDGFCSMPTWSPDGKRIAYVGTLPRSAEKVAPPGASDSSAPRLDVRGEFGRVRVQAFNARGTSGTTFHVPSLWVVDRDGQNRTSLTPPSVQPSAAFNEVMQKATGASNSADLIAATAKEVHLDVAPAWSPDGKTIAFVRVTFKPLAGRSLAERRTVWTFDLTSRRAEPLTVGGGEFAPQWSRNSAMMLFTARRVIAQGERADDDDDDDDKHRPPEIERLEGFPEVWLVVRRTP